MIYTINYEANPNANDEFERKGFDKDSTFYFLRKDL